MPIPSYLTVASRSLITTIFVLLFAIFTTSIEPLSSNYARLTVLRAYLVPMEEHNRIQQLRLAQRVQCLLTSECVNTFNRTEKTILQTTDRLVFPGLSPLWIIRDISTASVESSKLQQYFQNYQQDTSQVASRDYISLFGRRFLEARIFILGDKPSEWLISIQAQHDAPPPVILKVYIDRRQIGQLIFDRGDQSWAEQFLVTSISPGFHTIAVEFSNDYFNQQLGQDRNAYIRTITLKRKINNTAKNSK